MAKLIACLTQEEISTPYQFKSGVKVYSIEEALYYVYHNWKETDYTTDKFISWVKNILKEEDIAEKLIEAKQMDTFSDCLINFLSITEYFETMEIVAIKSEVLGWEKEYGWVRPKEEADSLLRKDQLDKAKDFYEKALDYGQTPELYNNMAITHMKKQEYEEAIGYFKRAYQLDKNNVKIILNLAEAYICNKDFLSAFKYLKKAETFEQAEGDTYYLYAKICMLDKNYLRAIEHLNEAIKIYPDNFYYYQLTNCYIKIRKYTEALETIKKVTDRSVTYYTQEAKVHAAYCDYPAAIQVLRKAVQIAKKEQLPEVLTHLASYYRLNYDIESAKVTIKKASNIAPNNTMVKLEEAKIKKADGKMRDYQKLMDNILSQVKNDYRNKF